MERGAEVGRLVVAAHRAPHLDTAPGLATATSCAPTLAIVTLLAATLTSLAPPYLAKLALDEGISAQDYRRSSRSSSSSLQRVRSTGS
jgi:hypothetical protein